MHYRRGKWQNLRNQITSRLDEGNDRSSSNNNNIADDEYNGHEDLHYKQYSALTGSDFPNLDDTDDGHFTGRKNGQVQS